MVSEKLLLPPPLRLRSEWESEKRLINYNNKTSEIDADACVPKHISNPNPTIKTNYFEKKRTPDFFYFLSLPPAPGPPSAPHTPPPPPLMLNLPEIRWLTGPVELLIDRCVAAGKNNKPPQIFGFGETCSRLTERIYEWIYLASAGDGRLDRRGIYSGFE